MVREREIQVRSESDTRISQKQASKKWGIFVLYVDVQVSFAIHYDNCEASLPIGVSRGKHSKLAGR